MRTVLADGYIVVYNKSDSRERIRGVNADVDFTALLVRAKTKKGERKKERKKENLESLHRTQVSQTHKHPPPLKLCPQLASEIDGRIIHHLPTTTSITTTILMHKPQSRPCPLDDDTFSHLIRSKDLKPSSLLLRHPHTLQHILKWKKPKPPRSRNQKPFTSFWLCLARYVCTHRRSLLSLAFL